MLAPLCALADSAGASQPLPSPFPLARYQQMTARSPFAVASAPAPAPSATPDFAAQLYVDGVAHLAQTDYVAIKSRDPGKPQVLFLAVGATSVDGLRVDRIKWSDETGKSTVDVSEGGQRATLEFDEALVAKNGADGGPAANGVPAGFPFNRGFQVPGNPQHMLPRDIIRARRSMAYQLNLPQ
jgi:hypothetical protein